jgi:hypothetical protein
VAFTWRETVLAAVVCGWAAGAAAQTLGTGFTYQGRLTDAGLPASGPYDLELKLFDAATGGVQVGPTVTRDDVPVAGGLFTVKADFGAVFTGRALWLEIGVRPGASQGAFTPLAGRQELTPSPNALFSTVAPWTGVVGKPTGFADDVDNDLLGGLSCADGQVAKRSGAAWVCGADADSGGDITGVTAGSGLTGGATSGTASLAVSFGGAGTATTVARSDHLHTEYVPNGDTRLLNVSGTGNTFGGAGAGQANLGIGNAFFGSAAGQQNGIGSHNASFGANAGQNNANASDNAMFGYNAGQASTGGGNAFFGSQTGDSNTTGVGNAFFGRNAGTANTTGSENSFFGRNAGAANTAGDNSFFGSGAGDSNTTGSFNSFFGRAAGSGNTVQLGNSFFGYQAGLVNQGSNNAFFGRNAGVANTTGFNSAFFGSLAGQGNTTGQYNAFFGALAGSANTAGDKNAYFGANAGLNATSSNNAFFGGDAGLQNTLGFGNTFVGYQAGQANSTGANNTIIGAGANTFGGTLVFATAIGAGALATNSNTVVLGRAADTVRVPGALAVSGDATVDGLVQINGILGAEGLVSSGSLSVDSNAGIDGNLYVGGTIRFATLPDSLNQPLCFLDSGPAPFGYRLGFCSSSLRFKTDVEDYSGGLDVVERLRPVTFTWRRKPVRDLGFIAEEVMEIDPLLATFDNEGQVQGVKYGQLTAVLVNAVKEQQAQIARQAEQIAALKALVCQSAPGAQACR